jgi:hypothetical protein
MKTTKTNSIALPTPVIESDLARPKDYKLQATEHWDAPHYTTYGGPIQFELWYTERFGWCIPTLEIRGLSARLRSRGAQTRRTYGISIKDGQLVRMGIGPHVKATHTVYVKKSRLEALRPLLDLMVEGSGKAGDCRDRISTRRANTMLRRSPLGGGAWWA